MGWFEFASAFASFILSHSLPVRPPMRTWLVARFGSRGFTLFYSALSLAVLVWLIGAAGRAPRISLWSWEPWQAWVPIIVMLPVCVIIGLSVARPNPFSFGGARNGSFDPAHPGIVRITRHPLLLALALWAAAHVVPNGDLAHVILFGTFAAFAAVGGRLVDRRKRHEMGEDWDRLRDAMTLSPAFALPAHVPGAVVRILAGCVLYVGLLWLHPLLFGVSPLP